MTLVRKLTCIGVIVLLVGCSGGGVAAPSTAETAATTSFTTGTTVGEPAPGGLRWCGYVPGAATAPQHDDMAPFPDLPPEMPANSAVSAETTARQLTVLNGLSNAVVDHYVDPSLNGVDWPGIVARYRDVVSAGLTDDDFYAAMNRMIQELGDEHSHFQSPAEIAAEQAEIAGQLDFVGIGGYFLPIFEAGGASLSLVFHDSPAERAGLRSHDTVISVDGQPAIGTPGETFINPFLGPEGSKISITVSHPGGGTETLDLVRERVEANLIDICVVPGTRIIYILLPHLFDSTLGDQIQSALSSLASGGPLDGVVIDNRMNGGGRFSVLDPILALFTAGDLGEYSNREGTRQMVIEPHDVNGSQTVPMVVLVGANTVSYGEVMSGILQANGRAQIVGSTTHGNVESLNAFDFEDGSRLWLAAETFEAVGATYGPWEETGIIPDVEVPTRWDLFDETNDPALAAAVAILTG